ncbi:hypothetical protein GCM10011529_01180 [Polymorphobacter glacialis]|uniref:Uncharacterized protein n=1 Tax=Sandarakinorhabdus glacialis TaxID=1614636 RepID=A0A917E3U5_9SPHN|nr:hypothetical protein [Polymorphobacter glacialis]GGD98820.1 hypothetical protein GCM10011529_01180 [Polymorphobacter glacialis]
MFDARRGALANPLQSRLEVPAGVVKGNLDSADLAFAADAAPAVCPAACRRTRQVSAAILGCDDQRLTIYPAHAQRARG